MAIAVSTLASSPVSESSGARPAPVAPSRPPGPQSQMAAFSELLEAATQHRFSSYADLHAFSVREFRSFWHVFLQSCRGTLGLTGSTEPVCIGDDCEHA